MTSDIVEIEEALRDVQRAASWLEDISRAVANRELPYNGHRAKSLLTAFAGVDEARARYNRALAASTFLNGR